MRDDFSDIHTPASEETQTDANTDTPALWQKGGPSPNPKGRPKVPRTPAEVKALAREHTVGAIETLVKVHKNPKSPPAARVAAASEILNRGWGRAPSTDLAGAEQLVIKVVKFAQDQIEESDIKTIEGTVIDGPGGESWQSFHFHINGSRDRIRFLCGIFLKAAASVRWLAGTVAQAKTR